MYVDRPDLEKQLIRSIKRNIHTIICGESGNGKSWLYRKILTDINIPYVVANCANASRSGSITKEIFNGIIGSGKAYQTSYEEEKKTGLKAVVIEGEINKKSNYTITQDDPLAVAFEEFSSNGEKRIIVLDNLETIFATNKLMTELADIIILLDDPKFSIYNINLLIVGLPTGVLDFFSRIKNMESVSNRIEEIEKVGSLDKNQVEEIISKGFNQLDINLNKSQLEELTAHVYNITIGIAQRVHEYCESLAYIVEDNDWKYTKELINEADLAWLKQGLRQSYKVIESNLNSKSTTVARRNQVIYTIGKIPVIKFDSHILEEKIKKEFPNTIPKTHMGIGQILSELASAEPPLIKHNEKTNDYSICDPRYLMCIRIMLYKNNQNIIIKKNFKI